MPKQLLAKASRELRRFCRQKVLREREMVAKGAFFDLLSALPSPRTAMLCGLVAEQTPSHTTVGSHLLVPVLFLSSPSPSFPLHPPLIHSPVHCPLLHDPSPPSPVLPVALSTLVGCLQPYATPRQPMPLTACPPMRTHSHTPTSACNVLQIPARPAGVNNLRTFVGGLFRFSTHFTRASSANS